MNMEIPLSYYDKNGQQERSFTLSGWFHSYTGTGMGFVSESYCKNAGYTMAEDGVLSLSLNKMPDDFFRIQRDVELNENQSFGGAASMKSPSGSVIAMVILLVFFIIGSGYLLIYNVLYISISKDTRFYGLMKTLGTTQKQIKLLVKNQAVKFACIGIPIGILLATAVSFVLNEGFTCDCGQNFETLLDFNWTAEAVTNVLDNAVKYTPSGGVVDLKITEYPSYLRLDVSDNGIGIPEEEQAKIFGRFYRGKQSAGVDGVGIGLYLTRDIVNKQNGYIKVASNEKGATFSLFLKKG